GVPREPSGPETGALAPPAMRGRSPAREPLDVAVVGMACVLPQADGLARYWANILAGFDAVTEVPPDRWDPARHYEAATAGHNGHAAGRRTPSKWGGFIPRVPFDALAYGIPPSSLAAIEPVQLLALEVAGRALAASCKELQSGGSDVVLCGGADLHNGIHDYLMFASAHALSGTGRCRTFDASADGIALGEGVVCVVLKRLADAERDGDRVYAVVKGIGASSDGRSLGLTAPAPEGQRRALERAYHAAGVSPSQVGLIEAHGTGTVVGDRTELSVLTEVFAKAGAEPGGCVLGSVKSQIGHTKCAAGLAGLVKAAAALHTGVRPPTNLREPNPSWDPEASPFFFDQQARPWLAAPGVRFAGISAFGFGGTNFHAVLQGYAGAPEPAHGLEQWPAELFCFRGNDGQVLAALDELARLLEANDAAGRPWSLRALAARSAAGAQPATPVRLALVADDLDDLARKLPVARALRTDRELGVFAGEAAPSKEPGREPSRGPRREPGREPGREATGRVAFLFPGQGSQRPGMLADLF